jgi:hypothetical protein
MEKVESKVEAQESRSRAERESVLVSFPVSYSLATHQTLVKTDFSQQQLPIFTPFSMFSTFSMFFHPSSPVGNPVVGTGNLLPRETGSSGVLEGQRSVCRLCTCSTGDGCTRGSWAKTVSHWRCRISGCMFDGDRVLFSDRLRHVRSCRRTLQRLIGLPSRRILQMWAPGVWWLGNVLNVLDDLMKIKYSKRCRIIAAPGCCTLC